MKITWRIIQKDVILNMPKDIVPEDCISTPTLQALKVMGAGQFARQAVSSIDANYS